MYICYVYTYIHTFMYICYVYTHTGCVCIHTHMKVCVDVYMLYMLFMYICYMRTNVIHTHTHICIYSHIYAPYSVYTDIHTYIIYSHIHICRGGPIAGETLKKKTYIYRGGPSAGETGAPQGRGSPRGQEGGAGASSCVKFARAP
jgi:hypothetical protein